VTPPSLVPSRCFPTVGANSPPFLLDENDGFWPGTPLLEKFLQYRYFPCSGPFPQSSVSCHALVPNLKQVINLSHPPLEELTPLRSPRLAYGKDSSPSPILLSTEGVFDLYSHTQPSSRKPPSLEWNPPPTRLALCWKEETR